MVNKITKLKKSEYMSIYKDMDVPLEMKQRLQLPEEYDYCVGDTLVRIGRETKQMEVYADERETYIVITPINANVSFCYSVYRVRKE